MQRDTACGDGAAILTTRKMISSLLQMMSLACQQMAARDEDTINPTGEYTIKPTGEYTIKPTGKYTIKPTGEDTIKPTGEYTIKPTGKYTIKPTGEDTIKPTGEDTIKPTGKYTIKPMQRSRQATLTEVVIPMNLLKTPNQSVNKPLPPLNKVEEPPTSKPLPPLNKVEEPPTSKTLPPLNKVEEPPTSKPLRPLSKVEEPPTRNGDNKLQQELLRVQSSKSSSQDSTQELLRVQSSKSSSQAPTQELLRVQSSKSSSQAPTQEGPGVSPISQGNVGRDSAQPTSLELKLFGLPLWLVVALVLALFAVFVLFLVLLYLCCRRRCRHKSVDITKEGEKMSITLDNKVCILGIPLPSYNTAVDNQNKDGLSLPPLDLSNGSETVSLDDSVTEKHPAEDDDSEDNNHKKEKGKRK